MSQPRGRKSNSPNTFSHDQKNQTCPHSDGRKRVVDGIPRCQFVETWIQAHPRRGVFSKKEEGEKRGFSQLLELFDLRRIKEEKKSDKKGRCPSLYPLYAERKVIKVLWLSCLSECFKDEAIRFHQKIRER